ncbi:MAG: diguanylate cyclase [Hydrogenophilus sp.]|nr:diguanylate cyclase [Hydrogenophilus sp.]
MKHNKNSSHSDALYQAVASLLHRFGPSLTGDALREAYYHVRGLPVPSLPAPLPLLQACLRLLPRSEPEIDRQLQTAEAALAKGNPSAAQPAIERAALWFLHHSSDASSSLPAAVPSAATDEEVVEFSHLLARLLADLILPFLNPDADLYHLTSELIKRLEEEPLTAELARDARLILETAAPIAVAVNDHARDLTRLLELILRHLDNFVLEAELAREQVAFVRQALNRLHEAGVLEEAAERLEQLIDAQRKVIEERRQAEQEIRQLLEVVIERLAGFAGDSHNFADELDETVRRIQTANSLTELRNVLAHIVQRTRWMQQSTQTAQQAAERVQAELLATRARMERLEAELKELSQQTITDPLTGLMNRRGLENVWAREAARAVRHNTPLSIAVVDLDNFKQFNDTHGHLAGDRALQHLAGIAKRSLRPQDAIARWGGEEFVILLPDANAHAAERTVQRLQRELTRALFFHNNQHHLITFSAGVAQWQGAGESLEVLIARADDALYKAKRTGRNRVVVAR